MPSYISAFPTHFDNGHFPIHLMCRCHLVSEFLPERVVPCVAVHLVHPWEEGCSMSPSWFPLLYEANLNGQSFILGCTWKSQGINSFLICTNF